MCGIVEIFGEEINFPLEHSIRRMTSTLMHRGPDDTGIWLHKDNFLAFGHHRLSILDHSQIQSDVKWFEGKQPSTENLVLFIWEQVASEIRNPAKLYKIKLRETPTIFTEYFGPEKS